MTTTEKPTILSYNEFECHGAEVTWLTKLVLWWMVVLIYAPEPPWDHGRRPKVHPTRREAHGGREELAETHLDPVDCEGEHVLGQCQGPICGITRPGKWVQGEGMGG